MWKRIKIENLFILLIIIYKKTSLPYAQLVFCSGTALQKTISMVILQNNSISKLIKNKDECVKYNNTNKVCECHI
jgi:hypothetical protein